MEVRGQILLPWETIKKHSINRRLSASSKEFLMCLSQTIACDLLSLYLIWDNTLLRIWWMLHYHLCKAWITTSTGIDPVFVFGGTWASPWKRSGQASPARSPPYLPSWWPDSLWAQLLGQGALPFLSTWPAHSLRRLSASQSLDHVWTRCQHPAHWPFPWCLT